MKTRTLLYRCWNGMISAEPSAFYFEDNIVRTIDALWWKQWLSGDSRPWGNTSLPLSSSWRHLTLIICLWDLLFSDTDSVLHCLIIGLSVYYRHSTQPHSRALPICLVLIGRVGADSGQIILGVSAAYYQHVWGTARYVYPDMFCNTYRGLFIQVYFIYRFIVWKESYKNIQCCFQISLYFMDSMKIALISSILTRYGFILWKQRHLATPFDLFLFQSPYDYMDPCI